MFLFVKDEYVFGGMLIWA